MDVHAAEYVGPRPFEACLPLLLRPSETRCPQLRRYPRSKSTSFVTAGLPFHFISQCDPPSTLTRYTLSTTWKFVSYSMLQHRMESQNPREAAPSHHFAGRDPPTRRDKAVLSSQVSLASVLRTFSIDYSSCALTVCLPDTHTSVCLRQRYIDPEGAWLVDWTVRDSPIRLSALNNRDNLSSPS